MPSALRRAPRAFYLGALAWLIWSVASPYMQLFETGQSQYLPSDASMAKWVMIEHIGRSVLDAAFLAGAGLNAHVLIFIFDRMAQETRA